MTLAERLFAVHAVPPFSRLTPDELLTVAQVSVPRRFAPAETICEQGGTVNRLFVRISGDLVDDAGRVLQPVVGTTLLLADFAAPFRIVAGPSGYTGLTISRRHFFTLVNECPALLVGFLQQPLLGVDYPQPPAARPS